MAGERLQTCAIAETGLTGDRRWALVDGTVNRAGKLLTNTQEARLMTYRARLGDDGGEGQKPCGLSRHLNTKFVDELAVAVARPLTLRDTAGVNFDDSPVLVVNLATVSTFAEAAGMPIDHRRFRGNIYVEGLEPEEEVGWLNRRIRAGT